ncbi:MAG: ABC transporter substrate-binding protein [Burkholderiales bacterium]
MKGLNAIAVCVLIGGLAASGCTGPWNNPYPAADDGRNTLYSAFVERPKHLDPVQSYAENEYTFISQIYMPPLQYHYLNRPYELVAFGAAGIPVPRYLDANNRPLPLGASPDRIAFSIYDIRIRRGILYQPHPAFALDDAGRPRYLNLSPQQIRGFHELRDFPHTGTRELTAEDYVFQIKRLAHPKLHSPIFGFMSERILGLKTFSETLQEKMRGLAPGDYLDLNAVPLEGAIVLDRYTYRIKIRGAYPQFLYWLAMPFFAPIPHEVEKFYSQKGMTDGKNLSLDWYPVGTGPYMLTVNNPNRMMVLERNPNYSPETYPAEGEPVDRAAGLLADAGQTMPFIDKVVFSLEKESIPNWNKFLQGYYDFSGISSDAFDQVVQSTGAGDIALTSQMESRGIALQTSVATSTSYIGFNMLDPVVGGYTERARKLRQAISIAVDFEEMISIFRNGRGIPAQGPIPPGIFGYREGREGLNPQVYDWVDGNPRRKSIAQAKKLLAEAGYPNGIASEGGKPLVIYFDATLVGADGKSRADWLVKQFAKIDLQLVLRNTDFNRFQDKIRKGSAQLFIMGWNADYPDPENFLFLFHGPQSRALKNGENTANYQNPEFDRLFEKMQVMPNGLARQALIDQMVGILRRDSPWAWGLHPKDYALAHGWVRNRKPNKMANNSLKYQRLDPVQRDQKRAQWNQPVWWPLPVAAGLVGVLLLPAIRTWRRREHSGGLSATA